MIHIKQAIVVEGKYDKIKLSSIVDAVILVTNGFQIYKNPEQLDLIRYYARTTGVILMTDADRAGFQIRNYLKGAIQQGTVYQVYTPDVYGKEHRKEKPSAEANSAWKASGKNCCWQPSNGLEFWRKKPLPKRRKNRLPPMTFTRSD